MRFPEPIVIIHGNAWKLADLLQVIDGCQGANWQWRPWRRRPALVRRDGGRRALYVGQHFDPAEYRVVDDGWEQDLCEICGWDLFQTTDLEHGAGYTDGGNWICTECYLQFVAPGELSA